MTANNAVVSARHDVHCMTCACQNVSANYIKVKTVGMKEQSNLSSSQMTEDYKRPSTLSETQRLSASATPNETSLESEMKEQRRETHRGKERVLSSMHFVLCEE